VFVKSFGNVFNCLDGKVFMESIIRDIKWSFSYLSQAFGLKRLNFINIGGFGGPP
jgi:hypothetical protein